MRRYQSSNHPLLPLTLMGILLLSSCAQSSAPRRGREGNTLGNPPGMVDQLFLIDTPEELGQGTRVNVNLATGSGPAHLVLMEPANRQYPRRGSWMSEELDAKFNFTELIPSWNVSTPPATGLWLEVRTKDAASGKWSPWLYMGQWGKTLGAEDQPTGFDAGLVHMDNLVLERPASAFQVRADFQSFNTNIEVNPSLRRVALCYSGVVSDPEKRKEFAPATQPVAGRIDLPVPYRAQGDNPRALRSQTCSPTSTTMVMAYWGMDRSITENALAIWDNDYELFGNWARAVTRAGELGLDSWLTRYRDWDHVKATLASGQPIVASIKFKRGEFPSSILRATAGHLIVIRGMTESGDIICNDPASRAKGNHVIYKASELGHAWFDHGGVAYIIHGKTPVVAEANSASPTTQIVKSK